jgi:hypothetical protein
MGENGAVLTTGLDKNRTKITLRRNPLWEPFPEAAARLRN